MKPASSIHSLKNQGSRSSLKKLLITILIRLFGIEVDSDSKLYQKYLAPFVLYVNSWILWRMPKNDSRKEMGLDRLGEGDCDDFDLAIKRNFDQQDEISTSMIAMARSLKTSTIAANRIVKRDIRRLNQAKDSAEGNMEALKQTSEKLTACSQSSMNWGLIVLAIVVFMIFLFMVFLMRVLKKSRGMSVSYDSFFSRSKGKKFHLFDVETRLFL